MKLFFNVLSSLYPICVLSIKLPSVVSIFRCPNCTKKNRDQFVKKQFKELFFVVFNFKLVCQQSVTVAITAVFTCKVHHEILMNFVSSTGMNGHKSRLHASLDFTD